MTPLDRSLLLAQAAATLYMTGLIWFVQVVHYPLFARVGREGFPAYAAAHQRRTTLVVGPPMLVEAATVLLLVGRPVPGVPPWTAWVGLALVLLLWLSTGLLQVPRHAELARGFSAQAVATLVATNAVRTTLWSARAALVLVMLAHAWPEAP